QPGFDFLDLGDGRLGAIVAGRRVTVRGGQATVIDEAPVPDLKERAAIPPPLGEGWLFFGERSVHFARSFEGPMSRIVDSMSDPRVGIGYGVVLVEVGGRKQLIDVLTRRTVPFPIPNLAEMFGLATGEVAARNERGEVYLARGRGKPFKKVATRRPVELIA